MEIVVLGTGCPVVSTERYGPAQLILADNAKILVDCGSGVTQRLVAAGPPGRALDALLLTHLHSDHLVDTYQLIVSSWHQDHGRASRRERVCQSGSLQVVAYSLQKKKKKKQT